MKTFVLTVSRVFPKTHKRAGEQTWFVEKINNAVMPISDGPIMGKKIHTIRANYELMASGGEKSNEQLMNIVIKTGKALDGVFGL